MNPLMGLAVHHGARQPGSTPAIRRGGGTRVWRRAAAACLVAATLAASVAGRATPPDGVVIPGLVSPPDGIDPGEILLGELNCVACHPARGSARVRLMPRAAPLLGGVADRARPAHLRKWLENPLAEKPGTAMPDLFHDWPASARDETIASLVHFLESLAPRSPAPSAGGNRLAFEQGRILFHRVGCVVCHAPREPASALFPEAAGPADADAIRFVQAKLEETSVPLGNIAAKYPVPALAAFLLSPLAVRPSGRMPSLNLTTNEAHAIAVYLSWPPAGAPPLTDGDPLFRADPARVRAGRERFVSLGCAACHELGAGHRSLPAARRARPLTELGDAIDRGCLAEIPGRDVPRFHLNASQRAALRSTLRRIRALAPPIAPQNQVVRTLTVLGCYGCHSRDGFGGPSPSRYDYFSTLSPTDLGDEGRLPPHLSGVGGKLRPEWLREVLTQHGVVRPYFGVRMPQFGASNVTSLASAFIAADWVNDSTLTEPAVAGDIEAGRRLVGAEGGLACISCHRFGPWNSTGIDVMDLTRVARRLRRDWFGRYLRDPVGLRPGTRMPAFWPDGVAAVTTVLEGNPERQIESIWRYLSQGTNAVPPVGVVAPDPGQPFH